MRAARTILGAWIVGFALGLVAMPALAGDASLPGELRAFVAARAGVSPQAVRLPPLDDFEPEASDPRARFEFSTRAVLEGLAPITVVVWRGQEELRRGAVNVRIGAPATVLVAARSVPAQAVLRESDVRAKTVEGRPPHGSIAEIRELLGKQTTRAVSAGSMWRANHVKPVPLVARGESVRLRIETGALWIEGPGRAREDGLAGDSIRVLNLTSRREVRGTVTAEGLVRVDP